ncbi:MAG TPA: carboxyltransferase domain-containing protein [Candidatus Nanopelagicales bacterium]|nr:carboxyltransferase domain-containing protein [Candidatus Nanopelagicales bacterium]
MTAYRVLPAGDRAVLVAVDSLDDALRAAHGLGALRDVEDLVPAGESVLVRFRPGVDLGARLPDLGLLVDRALSTSVPVEVSGEEVVLVVRYDGPDLDDVARASGLTRAEVVAAHTGTAWTAAFAGFSPGFVYLVGGDPRLVAPRRAEPRAAVEPGSVALAADYCSVYPTRSPGGWQLIGSTEHVMWDAAADPPAAIVPGMRVRFVDGGSS